MKKAISILLSIIMAIGCFASTAICAFATTDDSETCYIEILSLTEDGKPLKGVKYQIGEFYSSETADGGFVSSASYVTRTSDENGIIRYGMYVGGTYKVEFFRMDDEAKNYYDRSLYSDVLAQGTMDYDGQTVKETFTYKKVHSSISFETNGAEAIETKNGLDNIPDELPQPTKEGFEFAGWFTDEELNTQAVNGDTLTDDITLYAKWNCLHAFGHSYVANEDNHDYVCDVCGYAETQDHNFANGECINCGYVEKVEESTQPTNNDKKNADTGKTTTKPTTENTTTKTNNSTKSPNTGNNFATIPFAITMGLFGALLLTYLKKSNKAKEQ